MGLKKTVPLKEGSIYPGFHLPRFNCIRGKACCGRVHMLKNMRLVILYDMFLNPNFKMTTSFANIARTTASIFINLPNLPDKLISLLTFCLHASY